MSFGYKTAWFAARTDDATALAHVLGLHNPTPMPAQAATAAAYESQRGKAFITPALNGWTLAMSSDFLDLADGSPPRFLELLRQASARLGTEVQFFASYRVVETHAWARAANGEVHRAYLYDGCSGETTLDLGPPTPQEIALDHRFFDPSSPAAQHDAYWQRTDLRFPDEKDVVQVAGRWSIDPSVEKPMADGFLANLDAPRAAPSPPPVADKPWWRFW